MGIGSTGIHGGGAAGGGEANDGANVGVGTGQVFRDKTGIFLNFRTLLQGSGITITTAGNEVTITGTGEANTMSTDGLGITIVKPKVGVDLPVRSFVNTSTISWTQNADDIIAQIIALSITDALISATAGIVLSKLESITNDRFLRGDGTGVIAEAIEISKGGTYIDPVVRNVIVWRAPFPCTVTNVKAYRVGGTGATINARKNGSDNHLAADHSITVADVWQDAGAVINTVYVAGDKLEIMYVTLAASPTQVAIQVDFTRP